MTEVFEKMFDGQKYVIECNTTRLGLEVLVKAPATALRTLQSTPDFMLEYESRYTRWMALDDQGKEVAYDYTLPDLQKWGLPAYFKELGDEQCRKQLETLRRRGASLRLQDFSTGHFLRLFRVAEDIVERLWWNSSTNAAVNALRAVERHVERIKNEPAQVLVEDILSGVLWHHDHYFTNKELLAEVVALSIRSGGHIEMPADEILEELYALMLDGASKVQQAARTSLLLSRELFIPKGTLPDESIIWAPTEFSYTDGAKSGSFPITYEKGERDGKVIPVARLTIPLSLYRNKRVSLPELPHGIQLHLNLTLEGETVVAAFADQVEERVKKFQGGKRRGKQQVGRVFGA